MLLSAFPTHAVSRRLDKTIATDIQMSKNSNASATTPNTVRTRYVTSVQTLTNTNIHSQAHVRTWMT